MWYVGMVCVVFVYGVYVSGVLCVYGVGVCGICVCAHMHMCAYAYVWCPEWPAEGIRSPRAGILGSSEPHSVSARI